MKVFPVVDDLLDESKKFIRNKIYKQPHDEDNAPRMNDILNSIIIDGYYMNATDIHIEKDNNLLGVIFRLGGTLNQPIYLPVQINEYLLRHVILRGKGDISVRDKPQDISFSVVISKNKNIQIRCSIMYTQSGYSIVFRLLYSRAFKPIEEMVDDPNLLYFLTENYIKSGGLLLIAAPPAQGKTTLLYHVLFHYMKAKEKKKIITIEDPVEIILPNINQVNVNEDHELDFSDVIRSTLRQNPDILMIGELRDDASARQAVRSSLTGLPVMTTIHTKSTLEVISRLNELGVPLPRVATSVAMVISIRLLKQLCKSCRVKKVLSPIEEEKFAHFAKDLDLSQLSAASPNGCLDCNFTGFTERKIYLESLFLDQALKTCLFKSDLFAFNQMAVEKIGTNSLPKKLLEACAHGDIEISDIII